MPETNQDEKKPKKERKELTGKEKALTLGCLGVIIIIIFLIIIDSIEPDHKSVGIDISANTIVDPFINYGFQDMPAEDFAQQPHWLLQSEYAIIELIGEINNLESAYYMGAIASDTLTNRNVLFGLIKFVLFFDDELAPWVGEKILLIMNNRDVPQEHEKTIGTRKYLLKWAVFEDGSAWLSLFVEHI